MPALKNTLQRIAFVAELPSSIAERLLEGVCQFATPSRGFLTRDFIVNVNDSAAYERFIRWKPDAVVTLMSSDSRPLLDELSRKQIPVCNTALTKRGPRRGIVSGNAISIYDAVLDHFHSSGISRVAQVVTGQDEAAAVCRASYREYCQEKGVAHQAFSLRTEPPDLYQNTPPTSIDVSLARWLRQQRDHPEPVGIFTQQNFVGSWLCRVCRKLRIRVPDQIAIIGSDDFDVSLWCDPPLSSIAIPRVEIGFQAAKLVTEMLAGKRAPRDIVRIGGASVIARGSTLRPPLSGFNARAAIQYIEQFANQGITVQDVVDHTQGITRRTFDKKFQAWAGQSAGVALRRRKLSVARQLLRQSDLSVTTVAAVGGFCDDIEFRRVFLKTEGMSPRDYRKLHFG